MAKTTRAQSIACNLAAVHGLCALALSALDRRSEGVEAAKDDLQQALKALQELRATIDPKGVGCGDDIYMQISLQKLGVLQ